MGEVSKGREARGEDEHLIAAKNCFITAAMYGGFLGLSVMCWEVVAGISLVILALVFLPRYLKSGIATIPQFLETRYGRSVRSVTAAIFIVAYMMILLPFVLFLGANGLNGMLGLHVKFGVSELTMIWMLLVFIATVSYTHLTLPTKA